METGQKNRNRDIYKLKGCQGMLDEIRMMARQIIRPRLIQSNMVTAGDNGCLSRGKARPISHNMPHRGRAR